MRATKSLHCYALSSGVTEVVDAVPRCKHRARLSYIT